MIEDRVYDILKQSDDYVSGEYMSNLLGVSRTSVWKSIKKLKHKGCNISSTTNRGYKLISDMEMIGSEDISFHCNTNKIGKNIIYFDSCTSTNDKAREGKRNGDDEGTVYITDLQTKGRGRVGRPWYFQANMGIAMTILLKPLMPPTSIMPLSLIAGLAVCEAIEEETGVECKLKWPNDVLADNRKLAGILIETSTVGERIGYVVLGIGVNCNVDIFPEELTNTATSVMMVSGKKCSRKKIICKILEIFEKMYFEWIDEYHKSTYNSDLDIEFSYREEYKKRCINLNRNVCISNMPDNRDKINGIAKDITPMGNLVVEISKDKQIIISSGEVTVRGENGYI